MIFKTLPSIISSINQLGEASNKLKAINFSMVGLNAGNLDAYRNAISGISKEQAALLLSTQGLNQAQIDLVLSNEKVTASEIAEAATLDGVVKKKSILTVEQQKQLISSQALTTEKLAEISATLGLETAENGSLISKKALNAEMVKQQLESIGVVGSTQAQIMNMLGLTTAETSAATASNVLSGAMAKLSLAMSTNPIGALITVIGIAVVSVYGLTKAFDALTDSAEEIDERVDNLISKYNDLKTTADNNASTVESLADEYESLSKGVNDLGENVSLTSEEYARYNEIVNQIADIFPTLITGYTDEGTAILSLKGNVEQLRDAYKEAQQEAYNLLVATGKDSDGNDIMESYKNLSELDWWDSSIGAEDVTTTVKRDITKQILDLMSNMDTAVEEYDKLAQTIFDTYGDKGYNFLEEMGLPAIKDVFSDTSGITEEALIAGRATVQSYYQGFQSEIDTKLSKVKLMANAFLNTNDFYLDDSTNSELKNALSVMVNSIDEELANSFNGEQVKVGAYVNNIVNSIKGNEEVQKELIDLFTIDTTDMPVSDIVEQINEYINSIAIAINEDPEELKVRLGFDYVDDLEAQYQRAVDFAKDKFDGYDPTAFFKEHSINTQEEIDKWQKIAQGARDAAEAEKEYIQGSTLNENPISSLSITDTIDQLNTQLKPAFDSLKSAYQDIFTTDDNGNELFTLENVDLSMLDKIKSALDDLNKNEELGISIDYSSFETLANVLTSSESTADDVRNAMNGLAGTVVQSLNPSLQSTTVETYQLTQSMLESLGVANAEEVMLSSLGYSLAELSALRKAASDAGFNLANATDSEISMFIWEQTEAGNCAQELYALQLKKVLLNSTTINTSADIEYILGLANSAGIASNALVKLAEAKQMLDTANANGDVRGIYEAKKYANQLKDEIQNDVINFKVPEINFDGTDKSKSKSSKSGGSKSSSEKDLWLEEYKRKLEELKRQLNEGRLMPSPVVIQDI